MRELRETMNRNTPTVIYCINTHTDTHIQTHLLQCEMSRCCRCFSAATDLRLASVILGQSEAWSLRRPGEPRHRALQLTSVMRSLPTGHTHTRRTALCFVLQHTQMHTPSLFSPSVLNVLSLAASAMALKAASDRCGVSSRETADSERHGVISACRTGQDRLGSEPVFVHCGAVRYIKH